MLSGTAKGKTRQSEALGCGSQESQKMNKRGSPRKVSKKGANRKKNDVSSEDEEDECIAEFDICLAGSLRDQLQLLQYPLRPNYRPYQD